MSDICEAVSSAVDVEIMDDSLCAGNEYRSEFWSVDFRMKFFEIVSEMLEEDEVAGRSSHSDKEPNDLDSDNVWISPFSVDFGEMGD